MESLCFWLFAKATGRDQMGWLVARTAFNPGFPPFPLSFLGTCTVDLSGSQTLTHSGDQATFSDHFRMGFGNCPVRFCLETHGLYLSQPSSLLMLPSWSLLVKTAHLLCLTQAFLSCKCDVEPCDQELGRGAANRWVLFLF